MKILVTVKRVIDYEAKLKINANQDAIEMAGANMISNPFDEIAVEEALRLKEKHGGEIIAVTIGDAACVQQLRNAFAVGVDQGIHVKSEQALDALQISAILKIIVEEEKPDLIVMGKQAIDDDSHQVAEMLAERLGYGQAMQANTVQIEGKTATVVREADGGLETLKIQLPCVISADLRLNEPRLASLPGIMKAKSKPIKERMLAEFKDLAGPQVVIKKLEYPAQKAKGQMVPDVAALIAKLKTEAKVL